jgi:GTP diphosphokinase / guanosine-3',5'-bis(diphosphate) 3'-diphosphatase
LIGKIIFYVYTIYKVILLRCWLLKAMFISSQNVLDSSLMVDTKIDTIDTVDTIEVGLATSINFNATHLNPPNILTKNLMHHNPRDHDSEALIFAPTLTPTQPKRQVVSEQNLIQALKYLSSDEKKLVKKAFHFSDNAHLGQYRQSGEPYITHPLAVAEICSGWHLNAFSICAALLHDVIEDQDIDKKEIISEFGYEIYELVEGLTKLTHIEFANNEEALAANFNKLLASSGNDHHVLIIKIADRLHNMRTLGAVSNAKQKRIARETQQIYAPLAKRLGLNDTYNELEELSFKHSNPWRYQILANIVQNEQQAQQQFIDEVCLQVNQQLGFQNIEGRCAAFLKSPYMIYAKIQQQQQRHGYLRLRDAKDLFAFTVLVEEHLDCYRALGILHRLYKPKPGRFKDYIALPKRNGYKALHTTLLTKTGAHVGFQIRTLKMEKIAQSGVLAYEEWQEDAALPSMQDLLNSIHELRQQSNSAIDFLNHYKLDAQGHEIVVFDETATQMILAKTATALDFAYHKAYDLGHHAYLIYINSMPASFNQILRNGDVIRVITRQHIKPQKHWLNWVNTAKASTAIKQFLKLNGDI